MTLVVIVGATGTGKSDLSLSVAEGLSARGMPAEIVNADAMQLYRGMDVGTAKLTIGERRGIPHHLDDWGPQGGHDWPFWHHMMWEYVGRLL